MLILTNVPVQHLTPRDLRTHFEQTYEGIKVMHVSTTSEECTVDQSTGLSTAYVKLRSPDDARRVLDEVGKASPETGEITIGEGNDMVGGICVTGLYESNMLGDNKRVDRQQQHQQQQQRGQGYGHGGSGHGGYQDYDNYDYEYGGYNEQQQQQYPTQQESSKYPPRDPEQEKRRKEAREEARRRRQEEFEELRRAKEERRAKIAEVKAEFNQKRQDLTSKVGNLTRVEGVTEKQLALHKKMLGLLKDPAGKAAKMREILDLQKKVNETKKEVISIQTELEALDKEERERTKQVHIEHQQKQLKSKQQKYTLDKRSSTMVVSGFPFDCTFATDAVRKHFIAALSSGEDDDADAASNAIKSLEVEDDGQSVVIGFATRALADKAKSGGAQYQGADLDFKWRYGGKNSDEGIDNDDGADDEQAGGGEDVSDGEKFDAADGGVNEEYGEDDFGGGGDGDGEDMIDFDMDEDEDDEEDRWR